MTYYVGSGRWLSPSYLSQVSYIVQYKYTGVYRLVLLFLQAFGPVSPQALLCFCVHILLCSRISRYGFQSRRFTREQRSLL